MPTLDEIANDQVNEMPEMETIEPIEIQQPSKMNEMLSRILTAETGEGSIGDYLEHPMNFNNSKSMARILRGLTGIVGNLKLAIIDIVIGGLEFSKERKGGIVNDVSNRGGFSS